MKSSKSKTKISVATFFFEASFYCPDLTRSFKTLSFFMIFVKSWSYRACDADILAQLADNGLFGCSRVVGADS